MEQEEHAPPDGNSHFPSIMTRRKYQPMLRRLLRKQSVRLALAVILIIGAFVLTRRPNTFCTPEDEGYLALKDSVRQFTSLLNGYSVGLNILSPHPGDFLTFISADALQGKDLADALSLTVVTAPDPWDPDGFQGYIFSTSSETPWVGTTYTVKMMEDSIFCYWDLGYGPQE